jgi:hypothetical protein
MHEDKEEERWRFLFGLEGSLKEWPGTHGMAILHLGCYSIMFKHVFTISSRLTRPSKNTHINMYMNVLKCRLLNSIAKTLYQ